ncbi:Synaptotagmin-3 [Striga hermonthica]|uniref:Synaptotagmin-3 n=1 Tax=Striga hermonthica TaxID=68872 RepID=A0A9N7NIW1_STRHE|nr:Synaptotagmin-3 [Striga hermonthica]
MGFADNFMGFIGFGIGIPFGIFLGFFIFIHFRPTDVVPKEIVSKPFKELDSSSIIDLIQDLPLWVMSPDYERVDWLNKCIESTWPYFDKAACGMIRISAESAFAEYIGKFQIETIYFEHLTLGNFPPKVHGLKAQESKENELVIDLALRWAGNADIVLVFRLFSLQFSIQIVDIQISASTRISLRPFVPTFPCFSSIAISLMDKPKIDFGFKVCGADVMSIPGLYHLVQVDFRTSGATKKPVGILHVKVVRAKKLLNMDFLTTSDPYVKLSLTGERLPSKKTTVKMNNLNPEWNEDFKLIVKEPETQFLQLQLYDWEKVGAHDYLGMQIVPLNVLRPYEKKEFTLDLKNSTDPNDRRNFKPRGQITIQTTFVPFQEDNKKFSGSFDDNKNNNGTNNAEDGNSQNSLQNGSLSGSGLLLLTVLKARDVEGKSHNNPYATVIFRGDKRKTKIIKKTRQPHWNEEFQFVLDEAPVKDIIHVEVTSCRRRMGFMFKESLGFIDINLADVVYNGHINEKYHLINSRNGIIHLDIRWKAI